MKTGRSVRAGIITTATLAVGLLSIGSIWAVCDFCGSRSTYESGCTLCIKNTWTPAQPTCGNYGPPPATATHCEMVTSPKTTCFLHGERGTCGGIYGCSAYMQYGTDGYIDYDSCWDAFLCTQ